jgi:hypothetical protein
MPAIIPTLCVHSVTALKPLQSMLQLRADRSWLYGHRSGVTLDNTRVTIFHMFVCCKGVVHTETPFATFLTCVNQWLGSFEYESSDSFRPSTHLNFTCLRWNTITSYTHMLLEKKIPTPVTSRRKPMEVTSNHNYPR